MSDFPKIRAENELGFCRRLQSSMSDSLHDVVEVRSVIERLRERNSFRESCFCKGLVLPIVDSVATAYLTSLGGTRMAVYGALRCEGFGTPMYTCGEGQSGFSSHSCSNSYHNGDKSGRRATSRRSPDFCIRFAPQLRLVGEMKYVEKFSNAGILQVVKELRDYLSIRSEPTSDWGHDVGFGLLYAYGGLGDRVTYAIEDYWESDRIFVSVFSSK